MTKVHGRLAQFTLTDSGAVARDISANCNTIDHPDVIDSAETTGFGGASKTFIPGLQSRTIKLSGQFDSASNGVDDVMTGIKGGGAAGTIISSYVFGPEGTASGKVKYTGSCILTNYTKSVPVGGVITFSADLQCTGDESKTTY